MSQDNFAHNSQTVLWDYAEAQRMARDPEEHMSSFWEYFIASLVCRSYDLTDEEVLDGITGAGGDGGIDFIYTFVDGQLISDDIDLADIKKSPVISLVVGQAKTSSSFREDALNRLTAVTRDLLTLSVEVNAFADVYNQDVRAAFSLFRSTYRAVLVKLPVLEVKYYYAANRAPNELSASLVNRAEGLRAACAEKFPDARISVELLGSQELWTLASERPKDVATLKVQRVSSGRKGYISLVSLQDLDSFLRPDDGAINQTLFDSNVRHYLKSTPVNASIAKSLASVDEVDFWWLNNGVTILASSVNLNDDVLTIKDPQVVNGLQTSIELARYFSSGGKKPDNRALLVKVIAVDSDEVRDSIIRATNNQNAVSVAMLRATDDFQRTIEAYLASKSIFYDRRKGYWASQGKPIRNIVSIMFMAQTVMAVLLFRPDDARGSPSNLLRNDGDYQIIFSDKTPLAVFLNCATLGRGAESHLRRGHALAKGQVNNLRFYVTMYAAWLLTQTSAPNADSIAKVEASSIGSPLFEQAYVVVREEYERLGSSDNITKNRGLKTALKTRFDIDHIDLGNIASVA